MLFSSNYITELREVILITASPRAVTPCIKPLESVRMGLPNYQCRLKCGRYETHLIFPYRVRADGTGCEQLSQARNYIPITNSRHRIQDNLRTGHQIIVFLTACASRHPGKMVVGFLDHKIVSSAAPCTYVHSGWAFL